MVEGGIEEWSWEWYEDSWCEKNGGWKLEIVEYIIHIEGIARKIKN